MKGYTLDRLSVADGGMYGDHDDAYAQADSDGTTILSIKYNGGILLGADARTSSVSTGSRIFASLIRLNHVFCNCAEYCCQQSR